MRVGFVEPLVFNLGGGEGARLLVVSGVKAGAMGPWMAVWRAVGDVVAVAVVNTAAVLWA